MAVLDQHKKIAVFLTPVQQAIGKDVAVDQHCFSNDDPEIKLLLLSMNLLTNDIYVGISDNEEACEIYTTWDIYKSLSYSHPGEGDWTCGATCNSKHFGEKCQLID